MKKAFLIWIVSALILLSCILLLAGYSSELNISDHLMMGVIGLLVLFGIYIGIKRFSGARRGEPAEDEYTRTILRKASSLAYYVSLYIWVFAIFIKDRITIDTEQLLGCGIIAMGVVFVLFWIVLSLRGVRND